MIELEINTKTYQALEAKANAEGLNVYAYLRKLIREDVL